MLSNNKIFLCELKVISLGFSMFFYKLIYQTHSFLQCEFIKLFHHRLYVTIEMMY